MKRYILMLVLVAASFTGAQAQKFAIVDMEYILKKIFQPTKLQPNSSLSFPKNGKPKLKRRCRKYKRCIKTTKLNWFSFRKK